MISTTCPTCKGTGIYDWDEELFDKCPHCDGSGKLPYALRLPRAYELENENIWNEKDVLHLYPDVVEWLNKNKIEGDFVAKPCSPVDEDCLYRDGIWIGYLSDNLWMQKFGEFPEAWDGIPKRATKQRKTNGV